MVRVNKHSKKSSTGARTGHLGSRLRAMRTARGLTLDQLSRSAGVSKAMLSQIEQQKVNPTVAVMLKIAEALRTGIDDLLDAPEPRNILRIIPASDESYTFRADPLCTIRTLSPLSLEKSIEMYRITLEAGGELSSEPHYLGCEEFLYVSRGKFAVTTGRQETRVGAGDAIHYRADVPHSLRNTGKRRAEAYMIVRYKNP